MYMTSHLGVPCGRFVVDGNVAYVYISCFLPLYVYFSNFPASVSLCCNTYTDFSFNVLYADDDSCIHIDTFVDQVFSSDW